MSIDRQDKWKYLKTPPWKTAPGRCSVQSNDKWFTSYEF